MEEKVGIRKATALAKYEGVVTLTTPVARDILLTLWPHADKASPREFMKALALCVDYGLDPRVNDLHMLPFKVTDKDDRGKVTGQHTEYVTVRGISATRKVARRKHPYISYVLGPRYMTEAEEKEAYGKVDPDKVRFIVRLKDLSTGAEAPGTGQWNKYKKRVDPKTGEITQYSNEPKGVDKGNTMENMASIRAERQAYDRLFPADMSGLVSVPVVDERFQPDNMAGALGDVIEGEIVEPTEEPEGVAEEKHTATLGVITETEGDAEIAADRKRIEAIFKHPKWTDKKISAYLSDRCKDELITTLDKIPGDKVHKIASELADWETMQ